MLFDETIETVLFESYLQNKGLAESSIYNYCRAVEQFIKNNPNVNDEKDINKFLIKVMGKSNKRGTFYYAAIKHYLFFKHPKNVAEKIINNLIKPQDRDPKTIRQYISLKKRTDVLNYLATLNKKHFILALIQQQTGARIGDILRLEIGSINWEEHDDKRILRFDIIGKRQKRKSTYITNESIAQIVWDYIIGQGLDFDKEEITLFDNLPTHYFLNEITRKNMSKSIFQRCKNTAYDYACNLKIALKQCNVDHTKFSTHDWRRCFSRDIYDKYNDIIVLQNVLGHSNISTTSRYLRHSGLNTLNVLEKMQN